MTVGYMGTALTFIFVKELHASSLEITTLLPLEQYPVYVHSLQDGQIFPLRHDALVQKGSRRRAAYPVLFDIGLQSIDP